MEWLETIGSVAGGGVFGLIGSVVGQVSKYFAKKQEQAFQREKWSYERDMIELHMKAQQQETEQELAIVSQQGAWNGLASSIQADSMLVPVSTWAMDLKSLFRPFLTTALWCLGAWVFYHVDNAPELTEYMVYSLFFAASTATVWWFGDRALTPPDIKNR